MLTDLKEKLAPFAARFLDKEIDEIQSLFETPRQLSHGDVALPVFFLAKTLKKSPSVIAQNIAEKMDNEKPDWIEKIESLAGFINFHIKNSVLQSILTQTIRTEVSEIGAIKIGNGKKIVIDFSSPNVAKPMHIGHLRATMIGQAICNLARSQGFEVIGLNHLGDWGVQFGKLAWAYRAWGNEYDFENDGFESLYKLYVRFHQEAEKKAELNDAGSLVFKQLEEGDKEIEKLWKLFIEISMRDYKRIWNLLGVQHDLVRGESFYNDRLKPTEALLEKKGLLKESDGAMVVEMDDGMPPCLIRKSDGASLYATRDIASAIYRMEELKASLSLYVVGAEQNLHFKQVFQVLEKMNYPWAKSCHHISFGRYQFKDKDAKKMSSRSGNVIRLEDVLVKAIDSVEEVISRKNTELKDKKKVAQQVGIGAIIFNDLKNERVKNVDFDWERVLDFEGDSGPYIQYVVVRCKSLVRKYPKEVVQDFSEVLESEEERELIRLLLGYSEVLTSAFRSYKPNLVAGYLLDVCRAFNYFYHKHKILGGEEHLISSRMTLVWMTSQVLTAGLKILNIEAPEEM